MKKMLMTLMITSLTSLAAFGQDPAPMLHLDLTVQENGEPVEVKVNLPFSLIESMVPNIQNGLADIHFDEHDIDLRAIWDEVRAAGPNDFVSVTGEDANVSVRTDNDFLFIDVDSDDEGEINVKIPLLLGDLILGEENLDVSNIVEELRNWRGDLVTITGSKVNGRVWVE